MHGYMTEVRRTVEVEDGSGAKFSVTMDAKVGVDGVWVNEIRAEIIVDENHAPPGVPVHVWGHVVEEMKRQAVDS